MRRRRDRGPMIQLFMEIWGERSHKCINCGEYLGKEPLTIYFDHLLEKSRYPELELNKDNIILVCWKCHDSKTKGFPGAIHKELILKAKERWQN